jgi:hypothetical protein
MNNHTMSRRGLLAGVPAIAVAVAPAVATALPDPESVRRDAILDRHLDVIGRLDSMPVEDRRMILTACTDAIKMSMEEHACDAELLALKPQFDEVFEDWWRRVEADTEYREAFQAELECRTGMTRAQFDGFGEDSVEGKAYRAALEALSEERSVPRRYPPRSDEEIGRDTDKMYALMDKILSHHAFTREGLRMQCRTMIVAVHDDWSGRTGQFVASVASFLRMYDDLPDALAAELCGCDDEEDDEAA